MTGKDFTRRNVLKGGSAALAVAALPPQLWASERKVDVIIIGAGLSGLHAASHLERAGLSVRVLEGSKRIGGRMYTLDDVPGAPETGAQTIGPTYGRTLFLAQSLGLGLRRMAGISSELQLEPRVLQVSGERILPSQWETSPHNPFPDPYRSIPPDQLLMTLVGASPLALASDWFSPNHFELDYPVADLLRQKGLTSRATELLGISNNYGRTLDDTSLLLLHRNFHLIQDAIATGGSSHAITGGNQRLPEAMANALKLEVETGRQVTAINHSADSVTVTCADGSKCEASQLVITCPFTALREIDIKPGLPTAQDEAVASLTYGRVYQAHFVVEQPFWEKLGFMPNVWSDSPLERVFASDPGDTGHVTNLTVWINGAAVDTLDGMQESIARDFIEREFLRLLPEATGAVSLAALHSWQQSPFSRGSFAVWAPGEIERFSALVSRPVGRLHFAGEHTAQWSSGIEGALESGERVAIEILEKLG